MSHCCTVAQVGSSWTGYAALHLHEAGSLRLLQRLKQPLCVPCLWTRQDQMSFMLAK